LEAWGIRSYAGRTTSIKNKLFVAAAAAALCAAGSARAQSHVCQGALTDALSSYGVKWADLHNVQWDVDTWNDSRRGGTTIRGHQMHAGPASCTEGSLVVEMNDNCGINDIYTRGSCQIKGLPNHWW
jgi:hypothetical protein